MAKKFPKLKNMYFYNWKYSINKNKFFSTCIILTLYKHRANEKFLILTRDNFKVTYKWKSVRIDRLPTYFQLAKINAQTQENNVFKVLRGSNCEPRIPNWAKIQQPQSENKIKNSLDLPKRKCLPSPDTNWKSTEGYSEDKMYDFFLIIFF